MSRIWKTVAFFGVAAMSSGLVQAQTGNIYESYRSVESKFDCTQQLTQNDKGIIRGLRNDVQTGEARSRKEALKAARSALARNYNYALMKPWSRRDYTKVVVNKGVYFDLKAEYKRASFTLACSAIPDEAAYEHMWGEKAAALEDHPEVALIDLREMIKILDPTDTASASRRRQPAVDETLFKRPGDRENHFQQAPVMQASAACFTNLSPVSATQFKRRASALEIETRKNCLQNLANQARTVGWTDHPSLVSASENALHTKGYTVNRPSATTGTSATSSSVMAPADLWGEGWRDLSASYPQFDGVFLTLEKPAGQKPPSSGLTLLASNTMSEEALLDYAVYYLASSRLQSQTSGIAVRDVTGVYRDRFSTSTASRLEKVERDNKNNRRDIESLDRDIERLEDRIERAEQRKLDTITAINRVKTYRDVPNFDHAMADLQSSVDQQNARIAEFRAEIAELQSEGAGAASYVSSRPPVSQTTSGSSHRGAYYLFEQNYQNVIIFESGSLRYSCEKYLACADKMQAYNTLGPRLNVVGFEPLSLPPQYKPYDPNQ